MDIFKNLLRQNKRGTKVFEISIVNVEKMFEQMKQEAGWDTSEKLYWGYYFLDHESEKLQGFAGLLKKEGYMIVEIRNTGENDIVSLHVEEHTVHTPASLVENFHHLAQLANEYEIEVFDGWDVEQTNMNSGLVE